MSIKITTESISFNDNLSITGSITASGAISASGDLEVGGDVFVSENIKHIGDVDTLINFTDNKIQLQAGNIPFITADKDASTPYPLTINNGGNRVNFRVVDRNTDLLLNTIRTEFDRVNSLPVHQ